MNHEWVRVHGANVTGGRVLGVTMEYNSVFCDLKDPVVTMATQKRLNR